MNLMTSALELLARTKMGAKLLEDIEQEAAAERRARQQELADARQRLITADLADVLKRAKAVEAAKVKLLGIREQELAASKALDQAMAEARAASVRVNAEIGRLDHELRALADPQIDEALRQLVVEEERTRQSLATAHVPLQGRAGFGSINNGASIARRLSAVGDVRDQLENLKLEALSDEELAARIEALFASLPQIDDPHVLAEALRKKAS